MSNILRGAQETLPEYHFRLYSTKDEHGLSNQAIADLLNKEYGTNYDESKFRKEYQAYTRVWQEMIESKHKESVPSDILTELDIKLMEFDKEKLKFQDQKRMMRNDLRKLARLENLVEFFNNHSYSFTGFCVGWNLFISVLFIFTRRAGVSNEVQANSI